MYICITYWEHTITTKERHCFLSVVILSISSGQSGRTGVKVGTSCYFWLPCCFLNSKPSLIIIQMATLSNQCTSLRKLHLHSGLCNLLKAALHIFLFPHFHSKCITTNLGIILNNQELRELIFVSISYSYVYFLGSHVQNIGQYIEKSVWFLS